MGIGEEEKYLVHKQAALRAAEQGELSEKQVQALVDQREEEYKERQWALAEAQQGLVAAGSQETVETFVAEAQKGARTITNKALEEQYANAQEEFKKAEEKMKEVQTRQQSIADGAKVLKSCRNRTDATSRATANPRMY